ncbi:MAG TPA: UDP-N-acetylmuramate dehydrogenase [Flavobacterium sp.]|nr:UDP-N-acetylmuramate dehydrogenase [Flavobacterium sp.]
MIVKDNFDLTEYNAYRVKAVCRRAYFPETGADVASLFGEGQPQRIVIGSGHNLLLSKSAYDDEFVVFNGNFDAITIEGETIKAEAGATLEHISELARDHSLTGMEVFWDIPSSLGGAVAMNAGASGEEIKDVLVNVTYFHIPSQTIRTMQKEDMGFIYRNSYFQDNRDTVVLEAELRLAKGDPQAIREKMEDIKEKRWAKQPRTYPNCGSVFKRPPGRFVGPMIDELGLKGFRIGGAEVSEKHSGFIINVGDATGADIIAIIKEVKARVLEKFGVDLEVEQRII